MPMLAKRITARLAEIADQQGRTAAMVLPINDTALTFNGTFPKNAHTVTLKQFNDVYLAAGATRTYVPRTVNLTAPTGMPDAHSLLVAGMHIMMHTPDSLHFPHRVKRMYDIAQLAASALHRT
jgi:hypothetical protein